MLLKYLRTLSKAKGLRLRSDLSMLLGAGGLGRVNTSLTLAPSVSGPAPSLFWTLVTRSFDLKHNINAVIRTFKNRKLNLYIKNFNCRIQKPTT